MAHKIPTAYHVQTRVRTDPGDPVVFTVREGTLLFPDTRKAPLATLATEDLANLVVGVLKRSNRCPGYCPLVEYLIAWASAKTPACPSPPIQ